MLDPALVAALEVSQRLGMLGSRPVVDVVEHAAAFVVALEPVTGTVVDLGSGGGVPGLVIATARPDLRLVLVDRRVGRTDHLARLVRRLGLDESVTVLTAEVEDLAGTMSADAAVARGFGAPDITLRAALGVVRPGGVIVVSEPPAPSAARWAPVLQRLPAVAVAPSPDPRVAVFQVSRGT